MDNNSIFFTYSLLKLVLPLSLRLRRAMRWLRTTPSCIHFPLYVLGIQAMARLTRPMAMYIAHLGSSPKTTNHKCLECNDIRNGPSSLQSVQLYWMHLTGSKSSWFSKLCRDWRKPRTNNWNTKSWVLLKGLCWVSILCGYVEKSGAVYQRC